MDRMDHSLQESKEIFFNRFTEYANALSNISSGNPDAKFLEEAVGLAKLQTAADTGYQFNIANSHLYATETNTTKNLSDSIELGRKLGEHITVDEGQITELQRGIYRNNVEDSINNIIANPSSTNTSDILSIHSRNPQTFINKDLYLNDADIGKIEIRNDRNKVFMYDETEYDNLNKVIYQYESGEKGVSYKVKLLDQESKLVKKYGIDPDLDVEDVRQNVLSERIDAEQELQRNKSDRRELDSIKGFLKEVSAGNDPLEILVGENYTVPSANSKTGTAPTRFAEYMMNNIGSEEPIERVLQKIGQYIADKDIMNTPIGYTGESRKSADNLLHYINNAMYSMTDDSKKYPKLKAARGFMNDYHAMMNDMYYQRQEHGIESKVWLNIREPLESFSPEELQSISEYTRRSIEIDDANEAFFEQHKRALEQNDELRPLSPLNQIRRELDSVIYDINTPKQLNDELINAFKFDDASEYKRIISQHEQPMHTGDPQTGQGAYSRLIPDSEFNEMKMLYDANPESFTFSTVSTRLEDTRNNKRWASFAFESARVSVPQDKVAHTVTGFESNYVSLEADHILAKDITIGLDLNLQGETTDELAKSFKEKLKEADDYLYQSKTSDEIIRTKDLYMLQENFIEVRYEQEWVNEDLKAKNEKAFERVSQQVDSFKEIAPSNGIDISDVQTRTVSAENLIEQYYQNLTRVTGQLNDNSTDIRNNLSIPMYMQDMLSSHASWMKQVGNGPELQSLAYLALSDTFNSYAEQSKPIDLTEAGFTRMWEKQGKTAEEIGVLVEELSGRGAKERLDDYIFMDALTNLHSNWWEESNSGKRNDAIDSLLVETHDKLLAAGNLSDGNDTFTGSAEQIKNTLYKARSTVKQFPMYQQVLSMPTSEVEERLQRRYSGSGAEASFEEYMTSQQDIMDAADDYNSKDNANDPSIIKTEDGLAVKVPDTSVIEEMTDTNRQLLLNQLDEFATDKAGLLDTLDIAKSQGMDSIPFTHGELSGTLTRGAGNEVLAYYPDTDRTVKIVDDATEATSRWHSSELAPRLHYGQTQIEEDIVSAGELKREPFGSYDEYQRRGRGIMMADPNETVRLIKEVVNDGRTLTYMDMETTGVSNSTLPDHLIRPLEIYAQKTQWDSETNDFLRNADGDFTTSTGDQNLHVLVKPSEDIVSHFENIAAANDFSVDLGNGNTINVVDYANAEARRKLDSNRATVNPFDDIIAMTNNPAEVRTEVQTKLDNIWFARNLAKYGLVGMEGVEDRFEQHTGNAVVKNVESYIPQLMDDARKGIENLNNAGLQGEGRVVFGDGQIVVSNYDNVASLVNNFIGDDVLAGQNFAEADWAKIVTAASNSLEVANNNLAETKAVLINDVDEILKYQAEDIVANVKETLGADAIYEFNPKMKEVPNIVTESIPNPEYRGRMIHATADGKFDNNAWYSNVVGERTPEHDNQRLFRVVEPGEKIPKNAGPLNELLRLNASLVTDGFDSVDDLPSNAYVVPVKGWKNIEIQEDMGTKLVPENEGEFKHVVSNRELAYRVKQGENIDQMVKEGVLVPLLDSEQIQNQPLDETQKVINKFVHKKDFDTVSGEFAKLGGLIDLQQQVGSDDLSPDNQILSYLAKEEGLDIEGFTEAYDNQVDANRVHADITGNPPEVIEQIYASKIANPGEYYHNAEAQIKATGVEMPSGSLHMADTDVKTHLNVLGSHIRSIADDVEFEEYTPENLRVGDVVDHHTQLRKDMPLGIYNVDGVDNDNHTLTLSNRETGTTHTINSPSQLQMNKSFYHNFDFIGDTSTDAGKEAVDMAVEERKFDLAREQISKANNSAYAFNLHQLQSTGGQADALKEMKGVYDKLSEPVESLTAPDGALDSDSVAKHVAASNDALLGGSNYTDWQNKEITPRQQAAYEETKGYYEGPVGQKQLGALQQIDSMQQAGVIQPSEAKEMIRSMNEQIKQAGKERNKGYTRQVDNRYIAGQMDESFGFKEGREMVLDLSNRKNFIDDMWSKAEDLKGVVGGESLGDERKQKALNQIILPFLQKQGLIETADSRTLDSVAREVMANQDKMAPLEEIDFAKNFEKMGNDPEFLQAMDNAISNTLAEPTMDMTELQAKRVEMRGDMIDTLKSEGKYHPQMTVEPKLSADDVTQATVNFAREKGIGGFEPSQLKFLADNLSDEIAEESDLKGSIFNELYRQATAGNQSQAHEDPEANTRRMEAQKALNWIDEDGNATPVEERYFGTSINGKDGRNYAHMQVKDLPTQLIKDIEQNRVQGYTGGDNTIFDAISGWQGAGRPGQSTTAPETRYNRTIKNVNQLSDRERSESNLTKSQMEQMSTATKNADFEAAANRREALTKSGIYVVEDLEQGNIRPPGAIEETIQSGKQAASEAFDNMATAITDSGLGGAAKWVAGIGLATYAAHQFLSSGDPLKADRRPTGHGVGLMGGDEDDKPNPLENADNSSSSYQTVPGDSSNKGYSIRAKGEHNSEEDFRRIQQEIQSNLGDATINMKDSRKNFDRSWLEDQMSTYIDRGHL